MAPRCRYGRDERGETLVEVLVALVILGVAGVAILAGLRLSIQTSDIHRNQTTGGAYLRSFAEAVETSVAGGGYQPCATAASNYASVAVTAWPTGYTKSVASVESWQGSTSTWGACTNGVGIQRLKLKVTTSGDAAHRADETLMVIVRRPCNASMAVCT